VQERARRTQATVLLAAAEEFSRHGYAGATLDGIAARTGMTKGALYAHFSSKDALAHRLIGWAEEAWDAVITDWQSDHMASTAKLRAVFAGLARQVHEDVRVRAGLRLLLDAPGRWRRRSSLSDRIHDTVTRAAGQAQSGGEISSRYSVNAITCLLLAIVWAAVTNEMSEQVIEELWQMVESALISSQVSCQVSCL
jgi:AcrR family transcriptional regulator